VAPQRIGVATSTIMLFRTFGSAFAVSLMGTVMLARMQQTLSQLRAAHAQVDETLWNKLANPQNLLEPVTRAQIPAELLPSLTASLGDALWCAFLTGLVLMLLAVGASFFMARESTGESSGQNGKSI
jgi:hypothetical protein